MTSTADVVFVGALTLDAIAVVEEFPAPDSRQVARDIVHAGGGPAATAAVAAARMGLRVAMVGTVGADVEGDRILRELESERIDVSGVRRLDGHRSAASVVLVDAARGTRAIAARPAADPELTLVAQSLIAEARWVHADHVGAQPLQAHLATLSAEARPGLAIDDGYGIDGFTPSGVDLYAPTVAALVQRYGENPVPDLLAAARQDGARAIVATDGADGAWFLADGEATHRPAHPVDVVSTLGAGDVFHGALLAALADHRPAAVTADALAYAVAWASVVAALSCRGVDGRSAIPTPDQVRAALPELPAITQPLTEAR